MATKRRFEVATRSLSRPSSGLVEAAGAGTVTVELLVTGPSMLIVKRRRCAEEFPQDGSISRPP